MKALIRPEDYEMALGLSTGTIKTGAEFYTALFAAKYNKRRGLARGLIFPESLLLCRNY